jgi:thioredoxin 1
MPVIELTDATLDEVLRSSELPVLVDFTAPWCEPCRRIEPVLEALAAEQAEHLVVASLDTEAHLESARRHGVMSFPTLVVFVGGHEQRRLIGARGKGRLLEDLAPYL